MIRHAVFDLDGTLLDSVVLSTQIVNAMLADRGSARRVTEDQTRGYVSVNIGGGPMMTTLLGEACGDPASEMAEFRARLAGLPTPPSSLFPGVREGLIALQGAGVRMAICSAKPQALCEKVLGELGIAHHFDAVAGARPGLALKPDPAHLICALAEAGGARFDCCYVGDSAMDLKLAQNMDVPFIMVSYGYREPDLDLRGLMVADDFSQATGMVLGLLAPSPPAEASAARKLMG